MIAIRGNRRVKHVWAPFYLDAVLRKFTASEAIVAGADDQRRLIDEELGVVVGRRLGRVLIVRGDAEKDVQAREPPWRRMRSPRTPRPAAPRPPDRLRPASAPAPSARSAPRR